MKKIDLFVYAILSILERASGKLHDQDIMDQMEVITNSQFPKEELSIDAVRHHVSILEDAGFIKIHFPKDFARQVTRLTWQGHEHLAAQKRFFGNPIID